MRRIVRRGIPLVLAASVLLAGGLFVPQTASGAGRYRAGVVVQHEDGSIAKDCVRFDKRSINGYQLLLRSRFRFKAAEFDFGHAICRLDGEGCNTTNPKRCQDCRPRDGTFDGDFWAYYNQDRGETEPSFASKGITDRRVRSGDIDYWVFGDGTAAPSAFRLRDICRA